MKDPSKDDPLNEVETLRQRVAKLEGQNDALHARIAECEQNEERNREAFKHIEERLRRQTYILDQIQDRVTVTDLSGTIMYINDAEVESLGRSREFILGQKIDIYGEDPERGATQEEILRKTRQNGTWRGEVVNYTLDGREIIMDCRTQVIYDEDGAPMALCGISTDVTERKRAEEALRRSEEQFRIVSEMVSDFAYSIKVEEDGTSRIEWITDAYTRMIGYTKEEAEAGGRWRLVVHPDDHPVVTKRIERLYAGEPDTSEFRVVTKQGEVLWLREYARPFLDAQGRVSRIIGAAQDITVRKQAQRREVELAVERERVRMLEDFIGDASHDLRTPIAAMKLSLSVLERAIENVEMRSRHLRTLKQQTTRLETLLENMLSMVKLDREAGVEWQHVDVGSLVANVIEAQQIFAEQRGHTLVCECEDDGQPIMVRGNAVHLSRALTNILRNAIHYTLEPGTIWIRTCRRDGCAIVEVEDRGIGISPEDLPRIFERFYRADSARSTDRGGTGLGLAIVKKVVEQHGGKIDVESKLGEGSTFRVLLPLAWDEGQKAN